MDLSKVNTILQAFCFAANISPVNLDLPIIFQRRYDFANLVVADQEFLLMAEKRSGSLNNFVKQSQAVQRLTNQNVILVFRQLADDEKKKLLHARVSYLDYQENAYLPKLGFLYSKISDTKQNERELTPTEQRVLIILLLFVSDLVIDINKISQLSGLSVPSLYRIFKSYKERGWLIKHRKSYHLAKTKTDLFDEVKNFLKNPITKVVIISDEDFQRLKTNLDFKISHFEALSYLGMLANTESYGQYALSKKQYKKIGKTIKQPIFQGHRIELWTYDPIVFGYNSDYWTQLGVETNYNMVDPISLYLTLKDNDDPRIMEEVEELEEKIYTILGEDYAS